VSVSGLKPFSSLAYVRQTSASRSSSGATKDPQANGGASKSDIPLLSQADVTSRIQTTLPSGKTLSVFRFDARDNNLSTARATPSDADRREDNQMMSAFNQLTGYFNYQPRPEDIKLEGTAAIDLSV
jgi:hypothetical protein